MNGNGALNLALISTFNDNVDFGSRELADTAMRPQLIVTFDSTSTDTTAPSAPGTLTGEAPSHNRVDLSWGAASDNVGVTGYEILRDGAPIATVGAVTSYADTTVSPLTHYDYAVKALDAAGNRSTAEQHRGGQHAGAALQHDGDVRRGRRRACRGGRSDHQLRHVVEAPRDERSPRWRAI